MFTVERKDNFAGYSGLSNVPVRDYARIPALMPITVAIELLEVLVECFVDHKSLSCFYFFGKVPRRATGVQS